MSDFALQAIDVVKNYQQGGQDIAVLNGVCLEVSRGEKVAILGRSGSGKSTLLHILAGLDTPDSGEVWVGGEDLAAADNDVRARVRGAHMGFVYQNHHLLPEFSALENIALAMRINGMERSSADAAALQLLEEVQLDHRSTHLPAELSGGERQRVAVARAIAGSSTVILADEPTGNLDSENAEQVMALLSDLCAKHDAAVVVVTHDTSALGMFDRTFALVNGVLSQGDVS